MEPVIGFLVGVALSAAVFALALWRQVRRYKRLKAQIGTGEQILTRASREHLRRVKALTPVAVGVELARRHPLPSIAAFGATAAAGAALLIPVNGNGTELDAQPPEPALPDPAPMVPTRVEPEPEDAVGEPPESQDEPNAEPDADAEPEGASLVEPVADVEPTTTTATTVRTTASGPAATMPTIPTPLMATVPERPDLKLGGDVGEDGEEGDDESTRPNVTAPLAPVELGTRVALG